MEEKIQTLHPAGKQGVNISRHKYDAIRDAILDVITEAGEITFKELPSAVERVLREPFDGSISWYVTTVKLDLEARGMIKRVPGTVPQLVRLSGPTA